jgi:hypothetical protein
MRAAWQRIGAAAKETGDAQDHPPSWCRTRFGPDPLPRGAGSGFRPSCGCIIQSAVFAALYLELDGGGWPPSLRVCGAGLIPVMAMSGSHRTFPTQGIADYAVIPNFDNWMCAVTVLDHLRIERFAALAWPAARRWRSELGVARQRGSDALVLPSIVRSIGTAHTPTRFHAPLQAGPASERPLRLSLTRTLDFMREKDSEPRAAAARPVSWMDRIKRGADRSSVAIAGQALERAQCLRHRRQPRAARLRGPRSAADGARHFQLQLPCSDGVYAAASPAGSRRWSFRRRGSAWGWEEGDVGSKRL